MTDRSITASAALSDQRRLSIASAVFVMLVGLFLLWGAAFASPATVHNAAHDSRHALGFPCH